MKSLKIKTYTPTLSTFKYTREIKNSDLIQINKLINYKDDKGLSQLLESYVDKSITCNFDKAFSLINLRSLCVGEELKFITRDKGKPSVTVKLNLTAILKRLLENEQLPLIDFEYKDFKIVFKLPVKIYYSNFIVFLNDIVTSLIVNNENILDGKTNRERLEILNKIKPDILKEIKNHIKVNQLKYKIIDINVSNPFLNSTFSFYDNSFYYFIKFLFKIGLSSIYNKLYFSCQKLNIGYSDYCNLSPIEIDLLLAIYKKNNSIK